MNEDQRQPDEGGVTDALRAAIERTLAATAPAAAQTRERAGELVDELAKRGQDAREEIARRGQEAGAGIAKRGQEAQAELGRQLDALERRMASIEELLRRSDEPEGGGDEANPKAED
jgi:polyhydroxyalkanoate synthesis regulator phasin